MAFGKKKDEEKMQQGSSVIETGIIVEGDRISGSTSIVVRGIVKSLFELDADVTVDFEGIIEGDISCINCTVRGKVVGNVNSTGHLLITNDGSIIGDITCSSLEVNSGGHFIGSCNKMKDPVVVRRESVDSYNYDSFGSAKLADE